MSAGSFSEKELPRPGSDACSVISLPISIVRTWRRRCWRRSIRRSPPRAVREFVERADDELWLQLLTIMRKAEDPGLVAIQAILGWVVADEQPGA